MGSAQASNHASTRSATCSGEVGVVETRSPRSAYGATKRRCASAWTGGSGS